MNAKPKPYSTIAKRYAREIANGKRVAGEFTRLACQRFLDDLERDDIDYDRADADRWCRFCEKHYHIKGEWAARGELVRLEPWQVFIVCNIFGFKRKDGYRRFTEAYVRVARKNAKSTLAALIGLGMFVADGEFGAEVYSGASTEKQAWEVFRPARLMAKQHPEFADHYGIDIGSKNLSCVADNSKFEPVVGNPGDGASPSCGIVDEFHEHNTWAMFHTFKTGMGARRQPLLLIITTAGTNIASPCFEKDDEIKKVLQGTMSADDVFGIIYAADPEDDWTGVTALKKANPNLEVSVNRRYLDSMLDAARRGGNAESAYKTKHLNLWVSAGNAFLPALAWAQCGHSNLSVDDFVGKPCIFGVDLAARVDVVALIRLFYETNDEGNLVYHAFPRFWLPENRIIEDSSGQYARFKKLGCVEEHPDDEIDFALLRAAIKEEARRFSPSEIAFDPWRAAGLEQELTADGFVMVKIAQSAAMLTDPMNELEASVLSGRFNHPNNAMFNWMSSNLIAKEDLRGNKVPRREIPRNKIDGMVALIMAMNRTLAHREKRYEILIV